MAVTRRFNVGDRVRCGDEEAVGVVVLVIPPLHHPVRDIKRYLPREPNVGILAHKDRMLILRESESYVVRFPIERRKRMTTTARWPVVSTLRKAE